MKKIVALFLAVIMLLSSAALAEGMTAGTYQASAQGYHGSIVLKVMLADLRPCWMRTASPW